MMPGMGCAAARGIDTPAAHFKQRKVLMFFHIVRQCKESLENFEACFEKAERRAVEEGFDVNVLMACRLAPDMHPLTYQIQSACDYLKGAAAWLSGRKPPRHEDTEQTIEDLRARISKTVAFVESIGEAEFAEAAKQRIGLSWEPGKLIGGADYVLQITIPNVYFHLAMAYGILRHHGVDVGKMDFLGTLRMVDE